MTRNRLGSVLALMIALLVSPANAQQASRNTDEDAVPDYQPRPVTTPGSVAPSSLRQDVALSAVGQAGRRQTREQTAQQTGIEPMARIDARVQNRVQARIRNRIDRYYDPQANATSPFVVASDQARRANQRLRR